MIGQSPSCELQRETLPRFQQEMDTKDGPKQEKTEKKTKKEAETDGGKEQKRNRLTAAFATTSNEEDNYSDNDE